jgi:hypothetical protein
MGLWLNMNKPELLVLFDGHVAPQIESCDFMGRAPNIINNEALFMFAALCCS